jgi:hypothetical protein
MKRLIFIISAVILLPFLSNSQSLGYSDLFQIVSCKTFDDAIEIMDEKGFGGFFNEGRDEYDFMSDEITCNCNMKPTWDQLFYKESDIFGGDFVTEGYVIYSTHCSSVYKSILKSILGAGWSRNETTSDSESITTFYKCSDCPYMLWIKEGADDSSCHWYHFNFVKME